MTESDPKHEAMQTLANARLQSHRSYYEELCANWRHLETKAQWTISINGIFLAGVFAFVRLITDSADPLERWLLFSSSICFVGSVLLALLALRVRSVSSPPSGDATMKLLNDLETAGDGLTPDRLRRFVGDEAEAWESVNAEIDNVNNDKGKHVARAQWLMMAAICLVVIILIIKTEVLCK